MCVRRNAEAGLPSNCFETTFMHVDRHLDRLSMLPNHSVQINLARGTMLNPNPGIPLQSVAASPGIDLA